MGAALAWLFSEWISHGKPSVLGIASGAIAGLVAITPASGSVGPMGSIVIGVAAGVLCFLASTKIKRALAYDDSLDVFGIHCIGGIVGALLTGIFCAEALGGAGFGDDNTSIGEQLSAQLIGVVATLVYTFVVSFVLLKILDAAIGLRVSEDDEQEGLDLALTTRTSRTRVERRSPATRRNDPGNGARSRSPRSRPAPASRRPAGPRAGAGTARGWRACR